MRQTAATEKVDPLTRIQEEIKEVVRREQEYRQLATTGTSPTSLGEYDNNFDGNDDNANNDNDSSSSLTISPVPSPTAAVVAVVTTSLVVLQEDNASNTPSLASSVNSKESLLDEQHSDDSGISASSSPVNGSSANNNNNSEELKIPSTPGANAKEQRYIGPNCYNMTPEPPQQKHMTRTVSTPHLAVTKPRQFAYSPAHKGVMQRFIASRGKLQLNNNNNAAASNKMMLNSKSAMALNSVVSPVMATPPNTPMTAGLQNTPMIPDFSARNPSSINIPSVTMAHAVIERDSEGRPIRPGYVPVELKIQRELKDLKSRETELKKIRKIRQSTPDLLDSIDNENVETDDEDSEVEHCYGPGKLRNAKSISELCESSQSNNSISPRETPSPDFDLKMNFSRGNGGLRPAMSLAQLCDLDPEEAPSSHRLIAQWESLIQQHA